MLKVWRRWAERVADQKAEVDRCQAKFQQCASWVISLYYYHYKKCTLGNSSPKYQVQWNSQCPR